MLLCALVTFLTIPGLGQKTAPGIPPFKMLQTNGRYFSAKDLAPAKPVVLIYFAPDCDHCQVLLQGVFKNIKTFEQVQLVLVTFKPVSELALFERQYHTASYPNIKTGTEGNTFFLRYHFKLTNTPFTAVYNKAGALVCSFRNPDTPVNEILNCVKKLK
jgi:thiol-disulfide isomerase/thioredoxin